MGPPDDDFGAETAVRPGRNRNGAGSVVGAMPRLPVPLLAAAVLTAPLHAVPPGTGLPEPAPAAGERAAGEVRDALRRDDFDGAIAIGEAAAARLPSSAAVHLWLGRAYGRKAAKASVFSLPGLAKRCRAAFEKAVALDPEDLDGHFELMRYHLLAPGVLGGDHAVARAQAGEIARRDVARGHDAFAAILEHAKDYAGAEAEMRKAVAADPRSPNVASSWGGFLLRRKMYGEAEAFWKARLLAEPADGLARFALGRLALASGRGLPEAVGHLTAFLALPPGPEGPTPADGRWRLAQVYEKLGRRQDAARELAEALRLFPGHAGAARELARLRKG